MTICTEKYLNSTHKENNGKKKKQWISVLTNARKGVVRIPLAFFMDINKFVFFFFTLIKLRTITQKKLNITQHNRRGKNK